MRLCLTGWLAMAIAVDGSSADDGPTQDLAFFAAEAATFAGHTAARMPYLAADAPATVHIISRQDLEAFGAFHLWDALRGTPGMDVVAAGGGHGLVGIRGLTKVGNNRILILLDGRRISDTDSESLTWGSLPIPTREIERIEVVEGPASALYGGNALTGVWGWKGNASADSTRQKMPPEPSRCMRRCGVDSPAVRPIDCTQVSPGKRET